MSMHERFESSVDLLIAGALDDAERREIEEHARTCPSCAALRRDAEAYAQWVGTTLGPDAPPDDLEDRIVAHFRVSSRPARPHAGIPRWVMTSVASVAAVVLLVLAGAAYMGERSGMAPTSRREIAESAPERKAAPRPEPTPAPKPMTGAPAESDHNESADKESAADALERRLEGGEPKQEQQDPAPNPAENRKLIRNGQISIEVDSYDKAYAEVAAIVAAEKGFVATADTQRLANGKIRATVTVRVPPDRFEAALAALRGLGTVRHQAIGTQDVTKEYVDLDARLRSKETLVERLKKILLEAKGNVKELMEVEVQMGRTIEEIESIKGQLKYYDNLVGLATIVLQLFEKDLGQPFEYVQTLQSNLALTARDLEAAYAAAQKVVTDAGGQVVDSRLTRESSVKGSAYVRARVDAEKFPAVRESLRALGHVDGDTVEQARTGRGGDPSVPKPDAPVRREQAVIDLRLETPQLFVTRTAALHVEVKSGKAAEAYEAARRAIESAGGRAEGTMTGSTDSDRAKVTGQVDADRFAALVDTLKALGEVKSASVQQAIPPSTVAGTPMLLRERADVNLTITTPRALVPDEHGFLHAVRTTFANSIGALVASVEKLFVGLSLAAPWLVIAAVIWWIVRRVRARRRTAPPAA